MIRITLSDEIAAACPALHVLVISCTVQNSSSNPDLWKEIAQVEESIIATTRLEEINKQLPIQATRAAYKALGKDPNRYRPSAEALSRRVLRGLGLYQVDTLVDLINLVSLRSGYSIGGFDADKVQGDLLLGVGREGESYQAIGRGPLNIEGLPVYRDEVGGIGTPTSDEERTKIGVETTNLLMILNGYAGKEGLEETAHYAIGLLRRYVSALNIEAELLNHRTRAKLVLQAC